MKKILSLSILMVSTLLSFSQDNKYQPTNSGQVVKHNNFILSYVEKYEGAEWVCYELTYPELKNNVDRKTGNFIYDPSVSTGSAYHEDYTNSGYDRGHLAPAGDMNFDLDAMLESFYMSNVIPQTPELNRKTWKYLEDDIREYVARHKTPLYIITGEIIMDSTKYIGYETKIAVPTYCYKIVYDDINNKVTAFLMPNIKNINRDYFKYVVSIDNIEEYLNVNFFSNIPKDREIKLESNINEINFLLN